VTVTSDTAPRVAFSGLGQAFRTPGGERLLSPLRLVSSVEELLVAAPPRAVDRRELARGLGSANERYGHRRATRLAERLADPRTAVVVTGQQPGFLGGPLYSLVKALAAVRWAEAIERSGRPAVAVFWMATEDHDWAEVARVDWWASSGLREASLGEDASPLCPVGERSFGPATGDVLRAIRESLPGPGAAQRFDELTASTVDSGRFAEGFARLYCELLGDDAPLFLDAQLPELKAAERPWLRRLVEQRDEIGAAIEAAEFELKAGGLSPQVRPQPGAGQLFVTRSGPSGPERRRVLWSGEQTYTLRGSDEPQPISELLETIEARTALVSPGVLSRQAVQDAVLGTSLMVLGPGELAYVAQSRAVYTALGLPGTPVAERPHVVFVEPSLVRKGADWLSDLAALLAADFSAEQWLAGRAGAGAGDPLSDTRAQVERALDELRERALQVDQQLLKPWEKTKESALRALDSFAERWRGSLGRRDELELGRWRRLRDYLAPGDTPHERLFSVAPLAARWGGAWLAALRAELTPQSDHWQVIRWEDSP
jgi:bacillithiol biosynthesis cysteine-adding enzyme BshC